MKTLSLDINSLRHRGVSLLYLTTFAPAAIEKLMLPETPEWFLNQFRPTILGILPQLLPAQFYGLGILEAGVAILMGVALFRKNYARPLLLGLGLAFLTFIALAFGQRMSHKFDGAAQLFFYACFTVFFWRDLFLQDRLQKRLQDRLPERTDP